MDPAHRPLYSFVNCVNDPGSSPLLVDRIDPILHVNVSEPFYLIALDDFLARFLHLFFIDGLIDFQRYVLANLFRVDSLRAINLDLAHNETCLEGHYHLNAITFRLSENTHVEDGARLIETLNVLLDDLLGIGLADGGSQLRHDPLFAYRCRSGVLHID